MAYQIPDWGCCFVSIPPFEWGTLFPGGPNLMFEARVNTESHFVHILCTIWKNSVQCVQRMMVVILFHTCSDNTFQKWTKQN